MKLYFNHTPIAKARPRLGRGGVYDPQEQNKIAAKFLTAQRCHAEGHLNALQGPIELKMTFGLPIPRSFSRKAANASEGQVSPKKPDVDNMIKFYMDVFNGIVYDDDKQVVRVVAEKIYSTNPHVEITVTELENKQGLHEQK